MRLIIEGEPRELEEIKHFREAHNLPPDFGVNYFEPKNYSGLGQITTAGAELNQLRAALVQALPQHMALENWLAFLPQLTQVFEEQLYAINQQVGLKDVEVGFAVAGFEDVCNALLYALIQARHSKTPPPEFSVIYMQWLTSSVRISQTVHRYQQHGHAWHVQILNDIYGRVGLRVQAADQTYYVHDAALRCPADGFMFGLLNAVAACMAGETTTGAS